MKKIAFIVSFGIIIFFAPKITKALSGCLDYGMAYEDYTRPGYCKCMSGYIWGKNFMGNSYCVSGNGECEKQYGYYASYDTISGSCECDYGYVFGEDMFGDKQCVDPDDICREKLGYSSKYNSSNDQCECNSGYELSLKSSGGLECKSCISKYGYYSSYSYLSEKCECNDGYTLNEESQCVEKQNNVYFKLIELDTYNKKALIKSEYDNKYYSIGYRFGCYDSSFSRYVNKQIVVNLGTDFYIDVNDKIVLQDDDETCEIKSFEKVDSDFTLFPEESGESDVSVDFCKILYINAFKATDGKCYCFLGYSFNSSSNKCDIATTAKTTTTVAETKVTYDKKLTEKLKGKILLQTESRGEAWYVNPKDGSRYYMANGDEAYNVMRSFGVGVSNKDLEKIKTSKTFAKKNSGKILLQVENHGEAYYIDFNGIAHYLKDGAAAYEIMRSLGLGITNSNLNKLAEGSL